MAAVLLAACSGGGRPPRTAVDLSDFQLDAPLHGRVVENETSCIVDAVCLLRIELADTVVAAVYGTGERPAPPCEISAEASDAAFRASVGDELRVVFSRCGAEGVFLRSVEPVGP